MRSVLASALAALLVTAHAPVPAPGGGVPSGGLVHAGRPAHAGPSCCGEKACCAHGGACGTSETCALVGGAGSSAVGAQPSAAAPRDSGTPCFRLGSCAGENARLAPGSPDPGTLASGLTRAGDPPTAVAASPTIAASPTRALLPAEPPPRV